MSPAATDRQRALTAAVAQLSSASEPALIDYGALVAYLSGAARVRLAHYDKAVEQLVQAAGGKAIFLAGGSAYIRESLEAEFPELALFELTVDTAFVRASVDAEVYLETAKFGRLTALAPMRRELRGSGLPAKSVHLLSALLGLPSPRAGEPIV